MGRSPALFRPETYPAGQGEVAEFEFRLLGPLEVRRSGQPVEVRGAKPRLLLAILLLHAGEVVSTDRLIDGLWGERPPATASNTLQAHVAALRRALQAQPGPGGERVLVTRSPGYLLQAGDDALDIEQFERLVAAARGTGSGDPAAVARLLREALGLWRGPALAEFTFEPFAQVEAARLEELRLSALEDRLAADLALGSHAQVVPELEALVTRHPLRERFAGQLMLALYRCDRQGDALRVYHATRAALIRELGVEPGLPLRGLLRRVLRQDSALGWPEPDAGTAMGDGGGRMGTELPAHNLPIELTSFIGREQELKEISALVGHARLLTLTGAGGSGKTRLALRAARQAAAGYPDGVWLVELAALADPALVAKTLAVTLGVRQEQDPPIEALRRRLRTARMLIVLDNCEHLVQACAELVHALLSTCEGLRILATSREPLKVTGEVIWPVPGLAVPDSGKLSLPGELEGYAAVRLFAERAGAVMPGFAINTSDAEAVAQLCRRLDGMPLAIELAAARAQTLSPREIAGRLDDRFSLLTGGSRDVLARQQTLLATMDWSHDLLGRSERALFRRLSVFAGGWLLTDAEHVCSGDGLPAAEIYHVLCGLVAKSLSITEPAASGPTRYRMLETLREYARSRLTAGGEQATFRRRHFSYFLTLAEHAHDQKLASGSDAGMTALASQLENLRAGLAFAQAADAPGLLRLATAMEQLWLAGNLGEGRLWLTEALRQAPEPTLERARALQAAVSLASLQQDHVGARELAQEHLALSSALDDKAGEAWARQSLGFIEWEAGDHQAATRHLRRSLAMHQARGDRLGACRSLIFLATAMTYIPDSRQQGRIELERGLHRASELGDAWGQGWAQIFLGFADADAGDRRLAATRFAGALTVEALGPIRAAGLDGLAALAAADDPLRAIRLLGAATAHRRRHGGSPVPHFQRRSEAVRAQAEQRIDPLTAQRAWNEGLQMTTEEAIAYAFPAQPQQQRPAAEAGTGEHGAVAGGERLERR